MQVQFYQLSKRENSTLQPDEGVPFDIVFKEPVNFLAPVVRLTQAAIGANIAPVMYNYAYIAKFQRYYFVSNWEYIGGCWECTLSVDVLASWKAHITGQTVYVERAQSAYDGDIIDMQFPAKTNYTKKYAGVATSWHNVAPSGGTYVIGVLNDQSTKTVGAVTYYALTPTQAAQFTAYIFGNNIFQASSITEISEGLFKGLFNPAQYIVSCIWFPFPVRNFGTTSVTIKIGYWDTGISAVIMDSLAMRESVTCTLPDHDQAASRGSFLNFAPYAYYTLYVAPFGAIPIDSSIRGYGKYLHCPIYFDFVTGQATMRIGVTPQQSWSSEVSIFAGEVTAMFGVPIQLAQVMSDYTSSVGQMAGGVIGNIMSVLSGAVQSAISAFSPQVQSIGANGSFMTEIMPSGLVATFANITAASDSILGRPLMQQRVVGTLEGYIKCRDAHVMIPCTDREKTMIESYMNGGFYFE